MTGDSTIAGAIGAMPTARATHEPCPQAVMAVPVGVTIAARYELAPITGRAALDWIAKTHRHLPKVQGALYAVAVRHGARLVGVATTGNPARVWQGTGRVIITRCAALAGLPAVVGRDGYIHAAPVCTMLYGALCRASDALGYREVWTYTLPGESGASLLAAGFEYMGETSGGEHARESRPRAPAVNAEKKGRWRRHFGNPITERALAA